ncbi:hypothetical protein [Streptomyces marianii]|nr:hypothetical protein [Streptomyces marianii]
MSHVYVIGSPNTPLVKTPHLANEDVPVHLGWGLITERFRD